MSTPEYVELKNQMDRIEQLLTQLLRPALPLSPVSPAQRMIQLAKEGKVEESKRVPKTLMGRPA